MEGLGATVDLVRRVASDDPVTIDLLDQALQRPAHLHAGGSDVDIVHITPRPDGNRSDRALRKLRKDAPELHAEVLAGRLSAHAAMVQAGYRPRTVTVRFPVELSPRTRGDARICF